MIKSNQHSKKVGNKAKNLFILKEIKINVPNFVVISYDELVELLMGDDMNEKNILSCEIPNSWILDIVSSLKNSTSYAVRSSTEAEDSENKSFAGQFKTKLNVKSHQLSEAIKEVWLSIFAKHLSSYDKQIGKNVTISIIVQECIEADSSGVLFTINPLTNDNETAIINSVFGLGEGLVSGELNSDVFEIKNEEIIAKISNKTHQFNYNKNGDLIRVEIEEKQRNDWTLTKSQIKEIVAIGKRLHQYFGKAQDIEFCIKNDEVYILQSRPVTTLNNNSNYLVWDNSNIIESYPGITLPLTFSFISPVYSAVYQQMSSILGISKQDIIENKYTYDNMLGLLKGRVYYNLYSWYKLLSLLPGYSLNSSFMEKMMGVSERFELKDYKKPNGFSERIRVLKMAFIMIKNAVTLPKMKQKFIKKFNETIANHQSKNIERANAFDCMHAYYQFENTLSNEWKAPLVNDFFAMIYYGIFGKLVEKYSNGISNNQYLINTGKVITTEPAKLQNKISLTVKNDEDLNQLFSTKNENEIWQWLNENKTQKISILINEYIQKWGNRCFAELKLETITYSQNPLLFIKIIKNTFNSVTELNEIGLHHNKTKPRLNWFQSILFNFIKKNAVNTVTDRENLRFDRTRAFAEVRLIFSRIGVIFKSENTIENERDIFYLSKEEIFNYIKGTSVQLDLKSLINLRKKEYELYFTEPIQKARIKTYGIVYNQYFGTEITDNTAVLKGLGCCPGIVRGEVKIVHSPDDIENLKDKIMVTISTDPGWVSVFPLVKGILVQRGSVLSHAAIVSREMNIPCIVGISQITNQLKDGQLVEMNGLTGEIILL